MAKHNIILTKQGKTVNGTVQLTGSKSECNRALIIEALSNGKVKVENMSDAADAVTLAGILRELAVGSKQLAGDHGPSTMDHGQQTINIGPAGTAMRFLTAYLPLLNKNIVLTGSERMQQRPIGVLVDAMRKLGAEIDYVNNEGYPPIKIHSGFQQQIDRISIKGDISSQYITALLLIASSLPQGLSLDIEGELTSRPYVEMTLAMLKQAGIQHTWADNTITIENQPFRRNSIAC
jgi:3-phosphoshikimate 1-carboxyvinyltransferase